jgi:hypothetical protein
MLYHGLDTRTIVEPVLTSAATPSASKMPDVPEAEKSRVYDSPECTRVARRARLEGYSTGQQSARPSGLLYREL